MESHLFCCQTRIRRSVCACCNECCSATLGNRTSSLSPRQNGLVAMNVALQHWATVILPLKSNSRSSIYFCASFCCQTRIRRSVCACCNECCSATLGNRTSSLSPRQNGLVAMNVALQHWATVILPLKSNSRSSIYFCCQTRIRTQTDRTRICSATVTPFGNIVTV